MKTKKINSSAQASFAAFSTSSIDASTLPIRIFSNTDLMIMPTLDESSAKSIEGFGIAYIEAANFKIPSIASDIGGTPEAVIHNKTGLIIKDIDELDEAIKSLIDNNEDRLTLGQNAKIRAENELNWDIQIKKYNDLIKEIQ